MGDESTKRLLDDAFVARELALALAPYDAPLSAEEHAWMRERLAEMLAHDPTGRALLSGALPREIDESGERARLDVVDDDGEEAEGA
jgi:hypothetical protein